MTWKFIIPKAPWQEGGQFERVIGLAEQSLHRSIRISQMTYNELEEIPLAVEISLNNHPLTYAEGDIQLNVLTPNSMILGRYVTTINSTADDDSDEWTKREMQRERVEKMETQPQPQRQNNKSKYRRYSNDKR